MVPPLPPRTHPPAARRLWRRRHGLTQELSGNVGAIKFSYSGSFIGSVDATGALEIDPATNEPKRQSFSAGFNLSELNPDASRYLGVGIQLDNENSGKSFFFGVLGADAASYDLNESCFMSGTHCAIASLAISPDLAGSTGEKEFEPVSGAVKLSEIKNGRIKGTFAGTARELDPETGEYVAGIEVQITNGTFHVPERKFSKLGGMSAPARISRMLPLDLSR